MGPFQTITPLRDATSNIWVESQIIGGNMDPEKIRENMRRLSRIGDPGSPGGPSSAGRSGAAKPFWEPLPGDDLADIQKGIRQEEIAQAKIKRRKPPTEKRGPRGGRYTEATTKEGRRYRRYF